MNQTNPNQSNARVRRAGEGSGAREEAAARPSRLASLREFTARSGADKAYLGDTSFGL